MADTTFTTAEEKSNRDLIMATVMLLGAIGVFWYLDSLFQVSVYFWYSLLYVVILSPFMGIMLLSRPFTLKLSFWVGLATAVFLL